MTTGPFACLALVALVPTFARADTLYVTTTAPAVQPGATATIPVPRFDPALGRLVMVRATVSPRPRGTVGLENTSATPLDFSLGWNTPYWNSFSVAFRFASVAGEAYSNAGYSPPPMVLAAYDGVTDYAGTSGATHTTPGGGNDGTSGSLWVNPSSHDLFAGSGTVDILAGPLLYNAYWEGGQPPPPGVVTQNTGWSADIDVYLEYGYVPHPTALCSVAPFAFPSCPCNNVGASGAGCANSVDAAGALLTTSGTPSLTNDTLALVGTRMTNSNALYFQGSAFQVTPVAYGDGMRCVVGSVVRLGTRTNVAGSSSLPSAGGTPISVAGGVTAPGLRYYQIIYRDNGAFCTPSSFNAANGVSVVWTP